MPSPSTCEAEVERLHEFFVDWYAGTLDRDAFARMDDAIAPDFRMVTPDGATHDRSAVVEMVRDAFGRNASGEFDIEIRNVERVHEFGDHATVRYEEWQETPDGRSGRVSTVLFGAAASAPGGVVWLDLHETWLDRE